MMDYEISLVPDIKSEMLHKQKMRNLVVVVCIFIGLGCAGLIGVLLGVFVTQSATIASRDNEIKCLTEGTGNRCSGGSIMKTESLNELLTIQDQMGNIGTMNANKIKFSRVFSVLDVLLPDSNRDDNGNDVKISELSATIDPDLVTLSFDANATAKNDTGYRALEAFKKGSAKIYFDYGSYMRKDKETGDYVEIPSFCIMNERLVNGYVYGVYSKGAPGCEAPMVEKKESNNGDSNTVNEEDTNEEPVAEGEQSEGEGEQSEGEGEQQGQSEAESKVEYIMIRRTYLNQQDLEDYKNGKDSASAKNKDLKTEPGYYFESECLQYTAEGEFDEESTIATCPLVIGELEIGDSSYSKDDNGVKGLKFSASVPIDRRVFAAGSRHVSVHGPTRQNVTDSYIQIRNIFTKEAEDLPEGEE